MSTFFPLSRPVRASLVLAGGLVLMLIFVWWIGERSSGPGAWIPRVNEVYAERAMEWIPSESRVLLLYGERDNSGYEAFREVLAQSYPDGSWQEVSAYPPEQAELVNEIPFYPAERLQEILKAYPDRNCVISLLSLDEGNLLQTLETFGADDLKLVLSVEATAGMNQDMIITLFEQGVLLAAPIMSPGRHVPSEENPEGQFDDRYRIATASNWIEVLGIQKSAR
ncbi:hypothetical protein P3T73_17430 [Kiritimatiellota bacterium B12222]|nr:hypothetical protein P3T73_17430 [Kiritimatiellota bacterium B12222]